MTVTLWHAKGCLTASLNTDDLTLTGYPARAMHRLILDGGQVEVYLGLVVGKVPATVIKDSGVVSLDIYPDYKQRVML